MIRTPRRIRRDWSLFKGWAIPALMLGWSLGWSLGCGETPKNPVVAPTTSTGDDRSRSDTADAVPSPAAWFEDLGPDSGVGFTLETTLGDEPLLPEIVAGGGAAADFDQDGLLDLYLVQATGSDGNRLYRNLGEFQFEDVTVGAGVDDGDRFGMGAATGDFDGDGDVDLYVSNLGRDTLLRNDGDFRFTDVTDAAGLGDDGFAASATFFDPDGDGDLDLFVTRYVDWSPMVEMDCRHSSGRSDYCAPAQYDRPTVDLLYRNDGDGTFTDISSASGIGTESGTGLGVAAVDADGDGRLDLFVANDGMPDHLWMNRGDLKFEEFAIRAGCDRDLSGIAKAGMGVVVEDVDDDGDQDILVCNLGGETDSLHLNQGGRFVDGTARSGLAAATRRFTRFGLGLVDFDHDGHLDLYAANGRVGLGTTIAGGDDPYAEPDLLLRGNADGRFQTVTPRGGLNAPPRTSRGAIFGDFDQDGSVDVVVVDRETPVRMLRNVAGDQGRSLFLDVRNRNGGPAIGARVMIDLPADEDGRERRLTRTVHTDGSYLSARDPRVHVGLGPIATVPRVRVIWPDGGTVTFDDVPTDRLMRIDEPESEIGP